MTKFQDLVNSETPLLVDFYADWCGPCKAMAPILQEIAAETGDNVNIIKIDVDKNPQVAEHYQIQGVPTLMIFKKGELKWRQSGVVPKSQLVQVLKQFY